MSGEGNYKRRFEAEAAPAWDCYSPVALVRDEWVGGKRTKECSTWRGMISRCTKPSDRGYKNYGGRGIKVCAEWMDFSAFLRDVGRAPTKAHSIDRIDNDGDYRPGNVRWATRREQANNTRANARLTINGETHTMTEWADITGVPYSCIRSRRKGGVDGPELLAPVGAATLRTREHFNGLPEVKRCRVWCTGCGRRNRLSVRFCDCENCSVAPVEAHRFWRCKKCGGSYERRPNVTKFGSQFGPAGRPR